MKRLALFSALLVALAGCAPAPQQPAPATPEHAATGETAETAAPVQESLSALPEMLQAVDLPVLPYEEIRLVYHYALFDPPVSGYYTMCQNGRWGLMRNDGSTVLPCEFDAPIAMCSDGTPQAPAWIASREGADAAYWQATGQYLASVGEGRLCDTAHCGPGYEYYFWDESARQMFAYRGSLGPSEPTHISPGMQESRGWWFPSRAGTLTQESWGLDVAYDPNALYRYRSAEGTPLNNYEYQQAELFYHGALLAAARRGSQWVYLDGSGREVTDPLYDPVYSSPWGNAGFASPLLNGYAAISRDGKFGLLDSAGLEYLPCETPGVAWDGGLGWVKLADGWHGFRIASASLAPAYPTPAEEDPLCGVPLTTVFPDTYPGQGRRTDYTTIRDDNLNLRAGPGTEYDKIGSIPPGSPVQELGTSSTVPGWTFVKYQDWMRGWVSTQYLE